MRILSAFFGFLLLNFCNAQAPNFFKERIVSNVKTVYRDKYVAFERNGNIKLKKNTRENEVVSYNNHQDKVSFDGWYPNNDDGERLVNTITNYKYDTQGKITLKNTTDLYHFSQGPWDTEWVKISYKNNSRLDSIFLNEEISSIQTRIFDTLGRLMRFIEVNAKEEITERHHFAYDNQGNLAIDSNYSMNDSFCCIRKFIYDRRGNENFAIIYSPAGELIYYYLFNYDYDEIGNWKVKRTYFNGELSEVIYREFEYWQKE